MDNKWGTVCDDDWDTSDAEVVCRQLGYNLTGGAYQYAYFGQGTGYIWLDDVQCTGSETHLVNCTNEGIGNHNCEHDEDAGVQCINMGESISKKHCMQCNWMLCRLYLWRYTSG